MPKIKIGRSAVEKLQKPEGDRPVYYFDDLLTGFAVRVSPKGVKAFLVQGYAKGKLHRTSLGRYPKVSPEDARKRARAILDAMETGDAPDKRSERVKTSDALDEWLKVHVRHKLKARTVFDYDQIVSKVLKPKFGEMFVKDISRADLADLHHKKSGTPRRANYIIAVARSFFTYCEQAGYRKQGTNPAALIRAYPENRRERFLSVEELGAAASAIADCEAHGIISVHAAAALRLCILTGARQGEIKHLKWREVDLERRLLLLEDSKTGRRPVFLSEPACEILKSLPRIEKNPYVIAGVNEGEQYKNLTRAWDSVRKRAGLADVRLHDLRHTFASYGAAESLSLPMIGRLLGHRVPATTARYAHLAADPVTEANERVGARLASIMSQISDSDAGAAEPAK